MTFFTFIREILADTVRLRQELIKRHPDAAFEG